MSEIIDSESSESTGRKGLITKKRVGVGVLLIALVGVPVAIAQYNVQGAAAATVSASSAVADLEVTVSTSEAVLPGEMSDVTVTIENPNPFAVEVGTVTLDTIYMEPVTFPGSAGVVAAGGEVPVTYVFEDVVLIAPTADVDPKDEVTVTVTVDGVQYLGTVTPV